MTAYKVVLTHKAKLEVEAESPEHAVRLAEERTADLKFTPSSWSVKETEE